VLLTRFGTGSMWPRGGGTGAGTGATAARAADPASGSDPAPRP
jgi:hypothetical protein